VPLEGSPASNNNEAAQNPAAASVGKTWRFQDMFFAKLKILSAENSQVFAWKFSIVRSEQVV